MSNVASYSLSPRVCAYYGDSENTSWQITMFTNHLAKYTKEMKVDKKDEIYDPVVGSRVKSFKAAVIKMKVPILSAKIRDP